MILKNIYTRMRSFYYYNFKVDKIPAFYKLGVTDTFEIILEGGLGDIILGTQFINEIKRKNPNCYLKIFYRDDDSSGNPDDFSWGSTRKYASLSGELKNPIKEWIDCFYLFDEAIGCNIEELEGGWHFYPPQLGSIRGYISPSDFNKLYLNNKFIELNLSSVALEIYRKIVRNKEKGIKIVCLHLRRNADVVIEFAKYLQNKGLCCHFIILGSTEHQSIPDISELIQTTNLIDSYSLGVSTIDLLKITRESDLFIGGRGGFELFHWLSEVPSINFFDEHGSIEISSYLWPKSLWKDNMINELFSEKSDFDKIMDKHLSKKWL